MERTYTTMERKKFLKKSWVWDAYVIHLWKLWDYKYIFAKYTGESIDFFRKENISETLAILGENSLPLTRILTWNLLEQR